MKKITFILASVFTFLVFASCASTKNTLPQVSNDASAAEIVQLAQSATDKGDYDGAQSYYIMLLQRYGIDNARYVEGRYEIAHLLIKQKKYAQALPMLDEVINMYSSNISGLPRAYYKLAIIDRSKIPENVIQAENKRLAQEKSASQDIVLEEENFEEEYSKDESSSQE